MSVRRASLRTPEEQVEEEREAHPNGRSSVTSTNWDNARYKRHSGSHASLSSSTTAVGNSIPQRPHSSRTNTAPSVRPSLKGRAPSSQRIAYHFRNSSTGHLHHTQSYHYRDKNYPPYQHHYRKVASTSQTSVIRTSMYGQYGWYNYNSDSRKNSAVSLDRHSVYGQPNGSQSRQSLDSQSAYDREQERRSWYKQQSQGGEMSRRATVAAPPPANINTNGSSDAPRKAATLKKAPPPTHDRSTTSASHRSSRPLPPEPPTLPPPDLNPGWPPRGWHVYVSAMTQDYLYGGSGTTSAHRPHLEDYVFDQDTLTFVRRPQDDADLTLSPTTDDGRVNGYEARTEDEIPQAYAYEPSPGPGPRGRATQSLDIPREHAKFDFPFNAPPVPPLPADGSKAARRLSKKPPSKKSKSSKGIPSPETPTNGAAPNLPPTAVDSNDVAESSHNNQSTISLVSKKSTKSSKSKKEGNGGWFPWGRKRSKSVNGRDGEDDSTPPVPDLPFHLRTDMFASSSTTGSADGHVAALCDVSIQHDWALNAIDPSNPDDHAAANTEAIASEPEGSQGSGQFTPTESETSLSAQTQLNFTAKDKRTSRLPESTTTASPRDSSSADRTPYPSPPSSATGHHTNGSSHSRAATSPAAPVSQSTSLSPKPSPTPSRASTIIAPSTMNGRHSRRNSTHLKGGAYILDTLEGSRITSPYPEPQSTVIRRMSKTAGSQPNGRRSESRVSVVTAFSDDATMTPRSGSLVDLSQSHSRPMSALSSTQSALPGSVRGSSVDLHSRPMSAMSLATTTTAIATPLSSAMGSPIRGSSLDLGSSRPMSAMSSVTAGSTAHSYSPFPSFSYAAPGSSTCVSEYSSSAQSTPAKSPLGQSGHSRAASSPVPYNGYTGACYSPSSSPSPSSPSVTPQTPTKPKGWKRWTTLSGSPKKAASVSKGANASKVDVSKVRSASMDVRVASSIENGNAVKGMNGNAKAGQEEGLGEGALIWSAPTNVKLAPSPSKLKKKRKV